MWLGVLDLIILLDSSINNLQSSGIGRSASASSFLLANADKVQIQL